MDKIAVMISLVALALAVTSAIVSYNAYKNSKKEGYRGEKKPNAPYIQPFNFHVGELPKPTPYKSANLTNDKVLYPLNDIYVNYELPKISKDCPCTQFVQAP